MVRILAVLLFPFYFFMFNFIFLTDGFNFSPGVVTLLLSDEDFGSLVSGRANAQRLFMAGKLKIRGNVMKATKMEPILKKAQTKAKL